jgi:hypothetical protein
MIHKSIPPTSQPLLTIHTSPLKPGTTYIFEGHTKSGFQHNEFAVTTNTVVIQGVTCVEVHDTLAVDGVLAEDTRDWFAQDKQGNVWYFGENSAVISGGLPVSLGGTWTGGVSGARPGLSSRPTPPSAISTARSFKPTMQKTWLPYSACTRS